MDNKKGFLKGALTGALAMLVITAAIGAGVIVINHIDLGSMKKVTLIRLWDSIQRINLKS